jgi:hypothetical protein
MERWFIVGSVISIFLMLAVAGWHYQRTIQVPAGICASAEAHCSDSRL